MKKYEIWSEGYSCTGQSSGAFLMAEAEGVSFRDACEKYFRGNALFNPEKMTYWSCRLYDNRMEAQKSFG